MQHITLRLQVERLKSQRFVLIGRNGARFALSSSHGCASGTLSKEAFYALGPPFVSHGQALDPTAEVKV